MRRRSAEDGFSLIELLVVMSIVGTLSVIGGLGAFGYQRAAEEKGSATEMLSQFRKASELAVSEGRTYCVAMTTNRRYQIFRYSCVPGTTSSGATAVAYESVRRTQSSRVTYTATVTGTPAAGTCPSGASCVFFTARGTATPATITIVSSARSKTYTLHVEGLTSRVYL